MGLALRFIDYVCAHLYNVITRCTKSLWSAQSLVAAVRAMLAVLVALARMWRVEDAAGNVGFVSRHTRNQSHLLHAVAILLMIYRRRVLQTGMVRYQQTITLSDY